MASLDPAVLVGLGGAVGASGRYLVNDTLSSARYPVGTLTVNVVGSFVLALVTALGAGSDVLLFVGTGACGSFTTFSSFSVETVQLWEDGERRLATVNAVSNLAGAGIGVGVAWVLVAALA
jgi:CrcB protein